MVSLEEFMLGLEREKNRRRQNALNKIYLQKEMEMELVHRAKALGFKMHNKKRSKNK